MATFCPWRASARPASPTARSRPASTPPRPPTQPRARPSPPPRRHAFGPSPPTPPPPRSRRVREGRSPRESTRDPPRVHRRRERRRPVRGPDRDAATSRSGSRSGAADASVMWRSLGGATMATRTMAEDRAARRRSNSPSQSARLVVGHAQNLRENARERTVPRRATSAPDARTRERRRRTDARRRASGTRATTSPRDTETRSGDVVSPRR